MERTSLLSPRILESRLEQEQRCSDSDEKAKSGRTLKRHLRQDELDSMLKHAISPESKKDIKTRQHLMERSFAQATRYGFKRARWRRLWRVEIQEYLTAAIQNIKILLKDVKEPGAATQMRVAKTVSDKAGRTKPYPSGYARSSLFKPRWVDIAGFYRTLQKLLPYCHAAITG